LLVLALLAPAGARAQVIPLKDGLVGAWAFVSAVSQGDDGTRGEPFGATPRGIMIFTQDGRFSLFQSSGNVPRLAAGDRSRATPEEAAGVVRESIAYFGAYTVNEAAREILVTIEGSTLANLIGGPPQRRIVTTLTPTELAFTNPRTPSGVTLQAVWRRAAP
jgi:hypothetical protein